MFDSEKSGYVEFDESEVPASPKPVSDWARRAETREQTFCLAALDAVMGGRGELDTEMRLAATVFGIRQFERLPKYRRQFVEGYSRGARDALARRQGRPISISPPPMPGVPARITTLQPNAVWKRHPHGGGWVSSTAYVALTAYVGPGAAVYDSARVLDCARIYGGAQACEQAEIYDRAQLHGRAVAAGTAVLGGDVSVLGSVLLIDGKYLKGVLR